MDINEIKIFKFSDDIKKIDKFINSIQNRYIKSTLLNFLVNDIYFVSYQILDKRAVIHFNGSIIQLPLKLLKEVEVKEWNAEEKPQYNMIYYVDPKYLVISEYYSCDDNPCKKCDISKLLNYPFCVFNRKYCEKYKTIYKILDNISTKYYCDLEKQEKWNNIK